jgi:GNAT superfamily N-acetyltransferase
MDEKTDFVSACLIYWEYWLKVMKEDLSVEISDGEKILMVESHLNHFLSKGYEILLAFDHDAPIGIVIHSPVFNALTCIWALYVRPEYRGKKVGLGLVNPLFKKYAKILFQTVNLRDRENDALFHTEGQRSLLHKDEIFSTWILNTQRSES